jgi:hypothetical protein
MANSEDVAKTVKGAGALLLALDVIGTDDEEVGGDRRVAKIICDHELELRELVRYALNSVTDNL